MRVFDFECQYCGRVTERIIPTGETWQMIECPHCGGDADRIFSIRETTPIDADWIAGVRAVVDKSGHKPWCNELLRHPTRANLKEWMKKEGLRHRDPAEPYFPKVDREANRAEIKKNVLNAWQRRNRLEINSV